MCHFPFNDPLEEPFNELLQHPLEQFAADPHKVLLKSLQSARENNRRRFSGFSGISGGVYKRNPPVILPAGYFPAGYFDSGRPPRLAVKAGIPLGAPIPAGYFPIG